MASTVAVFSLIFTLSTTFSLLLLLLLPHCIDAQPLKVCKFDAIYQLGDSLSDTGNLIREVPTSMYARPPYGQNFVNNATGRCSNGMLMIDYFAQAAGLPFLPPYLDRNTLVNGRHGKNFAVAGAAALPTEILVKKNISVVATNSSLNVQLDWMSTYFNGISLNAEDCAEKLKTALFMVGEIGGNDFNFALLQGKPIEEVRNLVPEVVKAIKDAVTTVIGYGATRVVVPGNFPIGCLPIYLTALQTNNSAAYDEFHCLKGLNDFAIYYNDQLKQALEGLRKENPKVAVAYGDYYNAFQSVYRNALLLGFDIESLQKACCGAGGDYDFTLTKGCGDPDVPVCPNPDKRIIWDGIHLTQQAYKYISDWLIRDILPNLHC
ncbi:hypothetical protein ACB098_03G062400 [Castanea mollissima]